MNLFRNSLAAVALIALAVLLFAPVAEASRGGLPAAYEPALTTPSTPDQVLEAELTEPPERLRLFDDLRLPPRPLELVEARKTASGSSTYTLGLNVRQTGDLSRKCSGLSFQGLWTDPVTGIAYARNRWYDARTASWLSEDPKGAVDSSNLYAFVGWGPHAATDPMGTLLKRENVIDPEHLMYRYGDKFYQVSSGGAVYRVDIDDGGAHYAISIRDPETASAVMALTGKSACSTCGGTQRLAAVVSERAGPTADAIETAVGTVSKYTDVSLPADLIAIKTGYDPLEETNVANWERWLLSAGVAIPAGSGRIATGAIKTGIRKLDEAATAATRVLENSRVGRLWENFVFGKKFNKMDELGQVRRNAKYDTPNLAPGKKYVRPDFVMLNKAGDEIAIGDAKALIGGVVKLDDQARAFVELAAETETKRLIYYVPWGTKASSGLDELAEESGVIIDFVVVR